MKDHRITLRVTKELKDAVKVAAEKDSRTDSSFIEAAIREKIERDNLKREQIKLMDQRNGQQP